MFMRSAINASSASTVMLASRGGRDQSISTWPYEYRPTRLPVRQSSRSKLTYLSVAPTIKKHRTVSANPCFASSGIDRNVGPITTLGSDLPFQSKSYRTSIFSAALSFARHASNLLSSLFEERLAFLSRFADVLGCATDAVGA